LGGLELIGLITIPTVSRGVVGDVYAKLCAMPVGGNCWEEKNVAIMREEGKDGRIKVNDILARTAGTLAV
jgi:hypothetical protein